MKAATENSITRNISGCQVTLVFADKRDEEAENAVMQILMDSYEERAEKELLTPKD